MSVLFSARKTVTDVLTTVSATTTTVTHAAEALSLLSATAAEHASDYHQNTVITLRDTRIDRVAQRRNNSALTIAQQITDRDAQLAGNPTLLKHYNEMKLRYAAADKAALPTPEATA